MIERHVTFEIHPGKETDFEKLVNEQYRPAMAKMPGFAKLDLLRDIETPNRYKMVIRFESQEAAKNWRDSEAHAALKPILEALRESRSLSVYTVVQEAV